MLQKTTCHFNIDSDKLFVLRATGILHIFPPTGFHISILICSSDLLGTTSFSTQRALAYTLLNYPYTFSSINNYMPITFIKFPASLHSDSGLNGTADPDLIVFPKKKRDI